jgi:hypothetical protein
MILLVGVLEPEERSRTSKYPNERDWLPVFIETVNVVFGALSGR